MCASARNMAVNAYQHSGPQKKFLRHRESNSCANTCTVIGTNTSITHPYAPKHISCICSAPIHTPCYADQPPIWMHCTFFFRCQIFHYYSATTAKHDQRTTTKKESIWNVQFIFVFASVKSIFHSTLANYLWLLFGSANSNWRTCIHYGANVIVFMCAHAILFISKIDHSKNIFIYDWWLPFSAAGWNIRFICTHHLQHGHIGKPQLKTFMFLPLRPASKCKGAKRTPTTGRQNYGTVAKWRIYEYTHCLHNVELILDISWLESKADWCMTMNTGHQ